MFALSRKLLITACLLLLQSAALAAPGTILFSDDFERASLGPDWTATDAANSGISSQTANSPTRSMFTRAVAQSITSLTIDMSAIPSANLTLWVRRGADAFSEDPDANENLVIEYRNSGGSFIALQTLAGDGTAGEILNLDLALPADGLHLNFQVRIRQTGGSGGSFDFWHVDDITITETLPATTSSEFCDDFERVNLGADWTASATSNSGIGSQTANSATRSLFTSAEVQTITSRFINLGSTTSVNLNLWLRRGSDAFSENPDNGENMVVEYRNSGGSFTALQTFAGNGTVGQIYNLSFSLPADALHSTFQIRFRQTGGSGATYDFWHMDDVCLAGAVTLSPAITVTKTTDIGLVGPSGLVNYTMTVTNTGPGQAASVELTGSMPPFTDLNLDTYGPGQAFNFTAGSSALTFGFETWSDDDGVSFVYSPSSGAGGAASGFDGQLTDYHIILYGDMATSSSFTVEYQLQVR